MKRILIVVDMINDFIHPDGVLSLKDAGYDIIPVIKQKLDEAEQKEYPVIFLNDGHAENDIEFDRFPKHAVAGTWGSEIIDELEAKEGQFVITKQRYSGFYGTALADVLKDLDPDLVEVVGCCTSICVAGTVADLVNRDYNVVVDRDAVADFNPDAHDFFLDYQLPNIFGATIV